MPILINITFVRIVLLRSKLLSLLALVYKILSWLVQSTGDGELFIPFWSFLVIFSIFPAISLIFAESWRFRTLLFLILHYLALPLSLLLLSLSNWTADVWSMFVPTRQTSFFRKSKLYLKRKIDTGYVVFIEYSTYTTKKMCSVLHGYWNVATSDFSHYLKRWQHVQRALGNSSELGVHVLVWTEFYI